VRHNERHNDWLPGNGIPIKLTYGERPNWKVESESVLSVYFHSILMSLRRDNINIRNSRETSIRAVCHFTYPDGPSYRFQLVLRRQKH
jgi:hypothetical protein